MKYRPISFLTLILLLITQSCEEASIHKEMVRFDQAFIPVLYYTYQRKFVLAERAVYRLEAQWDRFDEKYKMKAESNPDWQEAFRQADEWLQDAKKAIREGEQNEALVKLDHLRYEFTEVRRMERISYYLDAVWDLEESLMNVAEIAEDPMLSLIDYEEFKCLTHELEFNWARVLRTPLDIDLFDLYPVKLEIHQNRRWKINTTLANFSEAVECGDGEHFAKRAKRLREAYLDYIAVFGNFKAPVDHFLAEGYDGMVDWPEDYDD